MANQSPIMSCLLKECVFQYHYVTKLLLTFDLSYSVAKENIRYWPWPYWWWYYLFFKISQWDEVRLNWIIFTFLNKKYETLACGNLILHNIPVQKLSMHSSTNSITYNYTRESEIEIHSVPAVTNNYFSISCRMSTTTQRTNDYFSISCWIITTTQRMKSCCRIMNRKNFLKNGK